MFYCEKCAKKNKWPFNSDCMFASRGPCELCKKRAICVDVPSSRLPSPAKALTPEAGPTPKDLSLRVAGFPPFAIEVELTTKDASEVRRAWEERCDRYI